MAATRTRRRPVARRSAGRPRARRRRRTVWRRRLLAVAGAVVVGGAVAAALAVFVLPSKVVTELLLPLRHEDVIRHEAEEHGVDASLVAAVIYAESRFSDQTSPAGARGLMQITPDTAEVIERRSGGTTFELDDLGDADVNIAYGTFHLAWLLDRYDGNEVAALAGYNAGEGNADRWGGSDLEIEEIGYPETRAYVSEVLAKRREYRQKYADELGYG